LVESYAGSVRRVTRAILGNADDADDAAQDGILAALVKLDRYDPARPFGPWLLRIAANAAIDRRRRRSVRDARVLGEDLAAADPLPDAETGSGRRWTSCRSTTAWRSCCSTSRAIHMRKLQRSWGCRRGPCDRPCFTLDASCGRCWTI